MTSELGTRTRSAVLLAAAVLALTLLSPFTFAVLCLAGAVILLKEWHALTRYRPRYLAGPWLSLYRGGLHCPALSSHRESEYPALTVRHRLGGDIAAYLVGKRFGRHTIAPAISPGKSWEGLAGSVVASAIIGATLGHVAPLPHAVLGAVLAVVGLLGDLFESSLKRHAGVKDSGTLIPGHGGLFDRVDALLPCAILSALALFIRLHR